MDLLKHKLARLMRASQPGLAGLGLNGLGLGGLDAPNSRLREVSGFGTNPGALRMFQHIPAHLPPDPALVVVLHGCLQSAAAYEVRSGWSTLSDRHGFALLFPQQERANNPNGCFNWFLPGDTKRGQGEARSIREMVERMIVDHKIDRRRVFVTGLSAGGVMTSVMLATYPEVFAGGAIIAGLPYGAATNMQEAFASMKKCPAKPPRVWGDAVRGASQHRGPWPRISVWHGTGDRTVAAASASETVKQWTDLHGLTLAGTRTETVNGYPRQVWRDAAGEDVIESYSITGMAHGTPLATGDGPEQCGAAGAFMLEAGISSTYHIAKFWGLAENVQSHAAAETRRPPAGEANREDRHVRSEPMPEVEDAPSMAMDVRAVITRALTAAGLMKGR